MTTTYTDPDTGKRLVERGMRVPHITPDGVVYTYRIWLEEINDDAAEEIT
jgi:hypothetical protein